jgi:hypothetical protein
MDTEYTKGFRAGQEFELNRIILLLNMNDVYNTMFITDDLIALIRGEQSE